MVKTEVIYSASNQYYISREREDTICIDILQTAPLIISNVWNVLDVFPPDNFFNHWLDLFDAKLELTKLKS